MTLLSLLVQLVVIVGCCPVDGHNHISDWLISTSSSLEVSSGVRNWYDSSDKIHRLEISNGGLLKRTFALDPAFGTIEYTLYDDDHILRALEPEAEVVLSINGGMRTVYQVGGLVRCDQKSAAFRAYWTDDALCAPNSTTAFRFVNYTTSSISSDIRWQPRSRGAPSWLQWPPKGIQLDLQFQLPKFRDDITVIVHYQMYDGMPVMSKWLTVESSNASDVVVHNVTVEKLAANIPFGSYEGTLEGARSPTSFYNGFVGHTGATPQLFTITDQPHGTRCSWQREPHTKHYNASAIDPNTGSALPLLECKYNLGPSVTVKEGKPFESFRVIELALDSSTDLTRASLMRQRLMQTLAPWTTEAPIFFHYVSPSNVTSYEEQDEDFQLVVDQMLEVGFEMLIYSFGSSGFRLEDQNATYLEHIRKQVQYANERGIEVGGYDLIVMDRGHGGYGGNVGDQWCVVEEKGDDGTEKFGLDACLASGWYDQLRDYIFGFLNATGVSMLELDGIYHGDTCRSTNHSHHKGYEDSLFQQLRLQGELLRDLRNRGVYINQPDSYFFQGGNRGVMGYSEKQFSLPRWQDLHISRMGLYDDLYTLLPTQGWFFLPLVEYEGGGSAAKFSGHNEEFEWGLAQYLGAGTAACYRGTRLFGHPNRNDMKARMKKLIAVYKTYRETLSQPIVHLRRTTMRSWDGWMHVNPHSSNGVVAMAFIFNPTSRGMEDTNIVLPLYYTGLDDRAVVTIDEDEDKKHGSQGEEYVLTRDYRITVRLQMPAKSFHYIVVKKPSTVTVQ